jgi:hypothetical protein
MKKGADEKNWKILAFKGPLMTLNIFSSVVVASCLLGVRR